MTTTPVKKPASGHAEFEEALTSICLRRGILACSIEEMNEDAAPVSEPLRSQVLLIEELAKIDERPNESNPTVPSSSSISYLWTPIKKTASVVGATASFVLKSPDLIAKALLPQSEYDEEHNEGDAEDSETKDYIKPTDEVVPRSLWAQSTKTIKIALDTIPPNILSASELRIALAPKLKELLSESRLTWLQSLPLEHWDILIRSVGLHVVPKDDASSDNATALYIIGETKQPKEARIALRRLDANLGSLEKSIADYEHKMNTERSKASRATTKNAKIHAMRIYKVYETKLNEAQASRLNLLSVRESIDGAANQRDTISALKAASDTLRTLRLDEDQAFDVMDELQTNMDEITLDAKLMNQNTPEFDDQALLDELNTLSVANDDTLKRPSDKSGAPLTLLPDISAAELKELDDLVDENLSLPATVAEDN